MLIVLAEAFDSSVCCNKREVLFIGLKVVSPLRDYGPISFKLTK